MGSLPKAPSMADLFFQADSVLSAKDKEGTNNLRRTYRDWRTGSGEQAHPDVLTYQHEVATDEQRAAAKMKRVKTTGDRLDKQSSEDLRTWSGSHNGSPSLPQARAAARSAPGVSCSVRKGSPSLSLLQLK